MFDKAKLYSSFTTVKRMYNVYLDRYLRWKNLNIVQKYKNIGRFNDMLKILFMNCKMD